MTRCDTHKSSEKSTIEGEIPEIVDSKSLTKEELEIIDDVMKRHKEVLTLLAEH